VIDAWIQHPNAHFLAQPWLASLLRWGKGSIPTGDIPIELTLQAMDDGGIDLAILSAWHGPTGALISNDEVAQHVAAHPGRFAGLASVDLAKPMDAVRELRARVEQGFKGLRMLPWLWETPPTDRRFYPLYAACVELGVPFCTQVGHTGPLKPSEVGRPIPYIDQVAIDFPELTIVGGHIGYPWTDEAIALAVKHERFFIDTSAYTVRRYPPALVEFLRGHGRSKVLFGTNYPMILPAKALEGLYELGLDDDARQLFLSGNARRVFGLPA
jgi:predicted TIM-barrel fold metal-dependent hydrolase